MWFVPWNKIFDHVMKVLERRIKVMVSNRVKINGMQFGSFYERYHLCHFHSKASAEEILLEEGVVIGGWHLWIWEKHSYEVRWAPLRNVKFMNGLWTSLNQCTQGQPLQ